MTTSDSRLREMLREVVMRLNAAGVRFAVVGGMAMSARGHLRATKDLDLMLAASDEALAGQTLEALGYELQSSAVGFRRYIRRPLPELRELVEWIDVLFAHSSVGLSFIDRAQCDLVQWEDFAFPVAQPESLIVMKLLAILSDPERLHDARDIRSLIRDSTHPVNRPQVESDARLVGPDVLAAWREFEKKLTREDDERQAADTPNTPRL